MALAAIMAACRKHLSRDGPKSYTSCSTDRWRACCPGSPVQARARRIGCSIRNLGELYRSRRLVIDVRNWSSSTSRSKLSRMSISRPTPLVGVWITRAIYDLSLADSWGRYVLQSGRKMGNMSDSTIQSSCWILYCVIVRLNLPRAIKYLPSLVNLTLAMLEPWPGT